VKKACTGQREARELFVETYIFDGKFKKKLLFISIINRFEFRFIKITNSSFPILKRNE